MVKSFGSNTACGSSVSRGRRPGGCVGRPSRSLVAAVGVAFLGCLAAAAPAEAQNVRVKYSVRLVGLPLGTAGLSGSIDPSSYRLQVDAKLTGLASMVSSSQGAATATGALTQGRVTPASYANTSANSKETRTVRMAMAGGAVRGVDIAPPFTENEGRVPLTDEHKRGVLDPLSALVMPVAGTEPLVGPAACNRSLPIFDGYTRFDVSLTYRGTRAVKTKGYDGPVAVCSVRYVPIAGHRPNRKPTQFMANNRDMEVWLAPLNGTRVVVPYRISVATMVGTTVIEASELNLGGGSSATASQ
ncbi:MAG: uncharacterized protein JWL93_1877 [Hyphomicrobiales bacterium]|nr:uncharacterized protein [Hyphomicrobiales bacterium]